MSLSKVIFAALILSGSVSFAGGGSHFGFNAGTGIPYTTQFGINYVGDSNTFSAELSYNTITITSGLSSASLTKPEFMMKWHPFSGAFFLGLGLGQQTLTGSATDSATGQKAKVEVVSKTLTPTIGWMWGVVDGGLFGGLDFGMQSPSGAETTITSILPSTNQAYQDAVKQGNDLGSTGFPVFTLLRVGYLF